MLNQKGVIDLSDKQSEAWHYLEDNVTTEVLYGGGAGGGKSYLGCLWHIDRRVRYPGSRGMIGRAKIANLEESTLITLKNVCHELGYKEGFDFSYNSQKHVISWRNGSKTILKDLFLYPADPDFISLGSTEYTDVFIEEANEITLKAFELVNSRIRYKLAEFGLIPKTLLTCNPGPGWVKETFILDHDNKPVSLEPFQKFVQSLVSDNPDERFSELYTSQLKRISSEYDQRRLLFGDWEIEPGIKNPFAFNFKKEVHTTLNPDLAIFNPSRQIIISTDFNLNPFAVTFHQVWQDNRGWHHHIFEESEIVNGSIPAMVDLIKHRFGRWLHAAVITGDAMGNRGDISQRDNATLYQQLLRGLGMNERQLKVSGNPTHENSRADCNYFLAHYPDFKINAKTCPNTIRDLKAVQCDAFGQIIKRDRKDLNQRADYLDTFRYVVANFHRDWIDHHQKFKK